MATTPPDGAQRIDSSSIYAAAPAAIALLGNASLPSLHGQLHCYVDGVDAHHARARVGGARWCPN